MPNGLLLGRILGSSAVLDSPRSKMTRNLILVTTATYWLIAVLATDNSTLTAQQQDREAKFFSLFSIVRFSNAACTTSSGSNGTCYTSAECASITGGSAYGSCASGFGVCCVISISTCGTTTQLNGTYWTNPGYSNPYTTAGQCSLNVIKCSSNICQLRLDFIQFNIAQPDSTNTLSVGQCLTDAFTVTGQSNTVPTICGSNANQHIYLDMTPGQDTFTLNMLLTGTTSRTWNIRISQIPCGADYAAPAGCLQYFMETTGTITSFNYQYTSGVSVQHLSNQDYTMCIRMNDGFCGVCYSVCTSTGGQPGFAVSGTTAAVVAATSLTDVLCVTDWLQIPCASDQRNNAYLSTSSVALLVSCVNKLCGTHFNALSLGLVDAPVYSYTKPFELRFHTDSSELALTGTTLTGESWGFCLSYTQQACASPGVYMGIVNYVVG